MSEKKPLKDRRIGDPFIDRRCDDDRREAYDLGYFEHGGIEKRRGVKADRKRNVVPNALMSVNGQAYVQKQNRRLSKAN